MTNDTTNMRAVSLCTHSLVHMKGWSAGSLPIMQSTACCCMRLEYILQLVLRRLR